MPEPTAAPARQPITVCTACGVITAITPVKTEGKGTAIGVVAGGLAGLIVGNQIGGGKGKTIAKVAGAAGGALIGNKIEKKVRAETTYEIKLRLEDGTETTVTQDAEPKLAVGDAVRIVDGSVVAR
jgi:outer membrane lipoprotein SlyB